MEEPGFWRAIAITPGSSGCTVELEDDMHHMRVVLTYRENSITDIEANIIRAPWSTCPGAEAMLERTFVGASVEEAAQLGGKKQNCTHLFDIAVLAAAHAGDKLALRYDMMIGDPVEKTRKMSLSKDGKTMLEWVETEGKFASPACISGESLLSIGTWISTLSPEEEEMARLLRGAGIISHGRQIPMERQSDATRIPPNCFTFQPERAVKARRIQGMHDFTRAMDRPLDGKPRDTVLP